MIGDPALFAFFIGIAIDAVVGDPRRMPHIARFIGWLAAKLEPAVVRVLGRSVIAGTLFWILVVGFFLLIYVGISRWLYGWNLYAGVALDIAVVFQCIAFKDLLGHVRAVEKAFENGLDDARLRVSYIVGRDTDRMGEAEVCKAAIESGSENLSDAVFAPLIWFLIAGPFGILVYRVSNTLDAIVGHRSERYERFGTFSARVDDVLNLIPARVCAVFILGLGRIGEWRSLDEDATKHPSPNAGWPEAAMARRLGVAIGGPMYADGALVETAQMNANARDPNRKDIRRSISLMKRAFGSFVVLALIISLLLGLAV